MLIRFEELVKPGDWVPWWPDVVTDEKWLMIAQPVGSAKEAEPILEAFTAGTGEQGFYISYGTTSEVITYYHWQAGRRLRTLEYAETGDGYETAWTIAEGEPEPWERAVYFNETRLRGALSCARVTVLGEPGYSPEAQQKLESYWRAGVVTKGEKWPCRGVRRVEWEIMLHYELPSYYVHLSRELKPPDG